MENMEDTKTAINVKKCKHCLKSISNETYDENYGRCDDCMSKKTHVLISQALVGIQAVVEKFRKIQENTALHGAENGLTTKELEILEKLIERTGEANLAADTILKRASRQ